MTLFATNIALARNTLGSSMASFAVSGVRYILCLRIAGRTSEVTQRLNCFAAGSFERNIKEDTPLSLIKVKPLFGISAGTKLKGNTSFGR